MDRGAVTFSGNPGGTAGKLGILFRRHAAPPNSFVAFVIGDLVAQTVSDLVARFGVPNVEPAFLLVLVEKATSLLTHLVDDGADNGPFLVPGGGVLETCRTSGGDGTMAASWLALRFADGWAGHRQCHRQWRSPNHRRGPCGSNRADERRNHDPWRGAQKCCTTIGVLGV